MVTDYMPDKLAPFKESFLAMMSFATLGAELLDRGRVVIISVSMDTCVIN